MPYGLPGKYNHDAHLNKWMDNCVKKVTGKKDKNGNPIDQSGAIAICKLDLKRMNYNTAKASIAIDVRIGEL